MGYYYMIFLGFDSLRIEDDSKDVNQKGVRLAKCKVSETQKTVLLVIS